MKLQKTIVLLLAGTALTTATAMAQQVGTATAVNLHPCPEFPPANELCN